MDFVKIILEKTSGIAKITLNRPEALNALDRDTHLELQKALSDIEHDETVRVVIITGKGIAFCTGADLKYGLELMEHPEMHADGIELGRLFYDNFNTIENLSKPVIAAVNGLALAGGCELMMACDMAIAAEGARIGDQHANYGLMPAGGATQRLPRLIGMRKAKELLLTGDWVSGKEAEALGLVNKAVPAEQLEEVVMQMARKLAERSPMASRAVKSLVNTGMDTDLATGLKLEREAAARHGTTEDVAEGFAAFMQKRKPLFKGR